MAAARSSAHNLNGTFQQRIGRYPFDFSQGGTARENSFLNAFSPVHAHAAYVIDWGNGPKWLTRNWASRQFDQPGYQVGWYGVSSRLPTNRALALGPC